MIVTTLFLASDEFPFPLHWQDTLLQLFFEEISEEALYRITKWGSAQNICQWNGILCRGEIITAIVYKSLVRVGNFNIRAIPSTVERITIEFCGQTFELDTRSLPRNLEEVNLKSNRIHGQIDLTALPNRLVVGEFSSNLLTGPILLHRLPPSLKKLTVQNNRIVQEVVYYDNLPKGIQSILLKCCGGENVIREVRSVDPDQAVTKKNIFFGIHPRDVH